MSPQARSYPPTAERSSKEEEQVSKEGGGRWESGRGIGGEGHLSFGCGLSANSLTHSEDLAGHSWSEDTDKECMMNGNFAKFGG